MSNRGSQFHQALRYADMVGEDKMRGLIADTRRTVRTLGKDSPTRLTGIQAAAFFSAVFRREFGREADG